MFEKYSEKAKQIIKDASRYSEEKELQCIGTEGFLLALFNSKDSICRYLLEEYDVTSEEIYDILNSLVIIRQNNSKYTKKLESMFKTAQTIAEEQGSEDILEEHLFFSLLLTKDTIFLTQLDYLGIDLKDILDDLKEVFNLSDEEIEYTTNLTKKAKNKEFDKFIGREEYLERMRVIISRKNKNNPLLVGNAGVGKTALVEGLASFYAKQNENYEILSLNLSSLLSNTKYRGDFEARIDTLTKSIVNKPNIILFIDEIHTIMGAGSSEGALDAANILKPFLARNSFKVIGATTIEEYRKTILTDKALSRRFQTVFVSEPTIQEMKNILFGIKKDYEKYHSVKVPSHVVHYIIEQANKKIVNRRFPDKGIDLLDEALSIAKMKNLKVINNNIIDEAIRQIIGLKVTKVKEDNFYKELNPLYLEYYLGIDHKVLGTISFSKDEYNLNEMKKEMINCLGITDEMFLDLDLSTYKESHSLSSLIGSPKGYVGYDEGGILSEHIASYPLSVVILSNYKLASKEIIDFLDNVVDKGYFYDKKGNLIDCKNLVLIYKEESIEEHSVGFLECKKEISSSKQYTIFNEKKFIATNTEVEFMKNKGYNLSYDNIDFESNKELYLKCFMNIINHYKKGSYTLNRSEQNIVIIKSKTNDNMINPC
ncbi:MAG: AAA family ATPase [bacterium]